MSFFEASKSRALIDQSIADGSLNCAVGIVANKEEIIFEYAAGFRDAHKNAPMQVDSIIAVASFTKLITTIAALQLVDEGIIGLDTEASEYLPTLKELKILREANEDKVNFSSPKRAPTIRELMTHTSGYVYPYWNRDFFLAEKNQSIDSLYSKNGILGIPLAFEPGSKWAYGVGLDILGEVIKEVTQLSLMDYFSKKIFEPLNMPDTKYLLTEETFNRSVTMMQRDGKGLIPAEHYQPSVNSPYNKELGGGGLYSTAIDYTHVLQMLLNDGVYKKQQILSKAMIDLMFCNQTGKLDIEDSHTQIPSLTKDFNLSFGAQSHWGLGFIFHPEGTQYGRPVNSVSGAGIFNSYFWIDRKTGFSAIFATQLIPFFDERVIKAYQRFEASIYSAT